MDYKKTIGTKIYKLSISEILQVYFGINKTKADFLLKNVVNSLQQQNMIVTDLESDQISYHSVMRNRDVFKNNYNKLLTKKDRIKYYKALKRRIIRECESHIYV